MISSDSYTEVILISLCMRAQFIAFNMADMELSEESSQSLVHKPQAVSVVWDYFGLKTYENETVIVTEKQKPVC